MTQRCVLLFLPRSCTTTETLRTPGTTADVFRVLLMTRVCRTTTPWTTSHRIHKSLGLVLAQHEEEEAHFYDQTRHIDSYKCTEYLSTTRLQFRAVMTTGNAPRQRRYPSTSPCSHRDGSNAGARCTSNRRTSAASTARISFIASARPMQFPGP
jgi:hypothetical protein